LWQSIDHTDPTFHVILKEKKKFKKNFFFLQGPTRVAEALGNCGSSLTLSCLCVCSTLFLGCWANVPAITSFCVFGGKKKINSS
jgi:hypothetical protein